MKTYTVVIEETAQVTYQIEARSPQEALKLWQNRSPKRGEPTEDLEGSEPIEVIGPDGRSMWVNDPIAEFTSRGKLKCGHCKRSTGFQLIEKGYTINHDLQRIEVGAKTLHVNGWDGSSRNVSEDGDDGYHVECLQCFHTFRLPDDFQIEWM